MEKKALESEDQGSGPVEQKYISSNVGRTVCRTSCLCSNIENYVLERVGIAAFMLRHFAIIPEQNGMFLALNSSDKVFIQLKWQQNQWKIAKQNYTETVKNLKHICPVKQSRITMYRWNGGPGLNRMTYYRLKYLEG